MSFGEVFDVLKQLLLDWRVIVAFVVVFLYLNFIFYISRYRKPQGVKRKIVKKKASAEVAPVAETPTEETPAE